MMQWDHYYHLSTPLYNNMRWLSSCEPYCMRNIGRGCFHRADKGKIYNSPPTIL